MHFSLALSEGVMYHKSMNNTLNNKALRPENGGSIPVEVLARKEFNGVKLVTPFWSVGFSQEGDGPTIGQRFDWREGSFIVVKLGLPLRDRDERTLLEYGPARAMFTAMAVANA
jgi:hypothetical protein